MKPRIILIFLAIAVSVWGCGETTDPIIPVDEDSPPDSSGPPNTPPIMIEMEDTSTTVGSTLWLTPLAYDLDGDLLTFGGFVHITLTDIKRGTFPIYRFIDVLRKFEFKPQAYDRPWRKVTLYVEDGRGGADSTTFYVYVN